GSAAGTENIPQPASDAFAKAIEKSLKVIETYSESRFVDDAFFILGRSHYHRKEYGLAERYLGQLLREYPWSPFSDETRVWLAKVHAELGLAEAVEEDLAPILAMDRPPARLLTEIHVLRGDMALRQGDIEAAMGAYETAAELAGNAARQAGIYRQLYTLALEQEAYDRALEYLDRHTRVAPSEQERVQARLTRVQLRQKGGDLDGAYQEIRNMVGLSEFAGIIPGLVLELGKIELQRGRRGLAVDHFVEVVEEYPTLQEASEAAFRVGDIYLTDEHEVLEARSYLKRVKRNSAFYAMAEQKLKQLDTIDRLKAEIRTYRAQLAKADGSESGAGEVGDPEIRIRERRGARTRAVAEPMAKDASSEEAEIDTAQVREKLAYAMFRLGEIQLFDMRYSEPALKIMADIVSTHSRTQVAAQAAYVLYVHTQANPDQAEFWRALLVEKYPTSPYGLLVSPPGTATSDPVWETWTDWADRQVVREPAGALGIFRKIRNRYGTEQSIFAIAYIYDEYLSQLDSAITAYDDYLAVFPGGSHQELASRRLDFLRRLRAEQTGGTPAPDPPEGKDGNENGGVQRDESP
ncbi:MAG: tetratricopeptide repeat protein, partial [Candidatus Neomarinimicrobiota bacterium]